MASLDSSSHPQTNSETPRHTLNQTDPVPSTPAERTRRQAGLFFGGAAFVLLSGLVTRRALARRYKQITESIAIQASAPSTTPAGTNILSKGAPRSSEAPGYSSASREVPPSIGKAAESQPGHGPNATSETSSADAAAEVQGSGAVLAIEALTLATLNVISWAVMTTGGLLWYLDIGNMEDLRRKVRGGTGFDGTGRTEREAEEEVEEWIANVLARKEKKDLIRERVAQEMGHGQSQENAWRNERGKER